MIHFMTDETRTTRYGKEICTIHNVDGYTTRKTILGAVHEIGKAIAKIDAGEGEILTSVKTEAEAKQTLVSNCFAEHGTSYCFELEEVSCASEWDEEKEEMNYEEGNFYFHIRFFVWEEVEEEQETTEATEATETAEENETATAEATTENESGKPAAAPDPETTYKDSTTEILETESCIYGIVKDNTPEPVYTVTARPRDGNAETLATRAAYDTARQIIRKHAAEHAA